MKNEKDKQICFRDNVECTPVEYDGHPPRYKKPLVYNSFPREVDYNFPPISFFAKGYQFIEAYKDQSFDYEEGKKIAFLADPLQADKWGEFMKQIPMPEHRFSDPPLQRELHYRNYHLRALSYETSSGWRKSLVQKPDPSNSQIRKCQLNHLKCNNPNCKLGKY